MEQRDFCERLKAIEERNQRVELDKDWETSWVRRVLLTVFTYLALGIYLWAIGIPRPFLNSIVPAVGFMISTLSMPWMKARWIKRKTGLKNRL